jgi:protein-S-isoprenylcysteine O-methyltransferase Ste14
MKVIAPAPLIYFVTLLEGIILQYYVPIYVLEPSLPILILAIVLFVAGCVLPIWSLVTMRANKTSANPYKVATALVKEGPYKFSRNPTYLGLTSIYLSIAIIVNSLWLFLLLLPMLTLLWWGVIQREEIQLEACFGDDYLAYKKRIRCWL